MGNRSFHSAALGCVASLLLIPVASAGWTQPVAGTYDFADPVNWSGGIVDGVFPSSLTFADGIILTLSSNTGAPMAPGCEITKSPLGV